MPERNAVETATEGVVTLPPDEGQAMTAFGQPITIKLTAANTGGAFSIIEVPAMPAGDETPPHTHPSDEVFFVLEGELTALAAERMTRATAGSLLFFPKGVVHAIRNDGAKPDRALVVWAPAGPERMFEELAKLPPGPPDMGKIAEIAAQNGMQIVLPGQ